MQIKNGGRFVVAAALLCGANAALAADKVSLQTADDMTLGLSLSQYDYREPNMLIPTGTTTTAISDVKQAGTTYGVHGEKTWALSDGDFLRFDANFQGGKVDYHGSGSMPNQTMRFYEVRMVYGVDDEFLRGVLSTYAGLGYRYLYNDARGSVRVGTTTYVGDEREQQYTYLPVGVTYRTMLGAKRLTLNGELGLLLMGSNHSHNDTFSDTFKQRSGFEARLAATLNQGAWEVGPYVQYWKVNDSDKNYEYVGRTLTASWEPKNTTVDVGIKVDRHF